MEEEDGRFETERLCVQVGESGREERGLSVRDYVCVGGGGVPGGMCVCVQFQTIEFFLYNYLSDSAVQFQTMNNYFCTISDYEQQIIVVS